MKTFISRSLVLGAALLLSLSLRADPALVGHAGLKGQSLDADAIKAVLLGKRVTLGDSRVVVVIIKNSATQDAFLHSHVAMTTSQFQTYWRRLFMTGGGSAPKIVDTEADACKLVAETTGAITVADSASASSLVVLGK